MNVLYFHNPHDRVSTNLLSECLAVFPNLRVIDFMEARKEHWFRGCPSILIEGLWQKEVDVSLNDFQTALNTFKELRIEGSQANGEGTFIVSCLDPFGNTCPLPNDCILTIGRDVYPVTDNDPCLEIIFADPGVYVLTVSATNCLPASLEVVA